MIKQLEPKRIANYVFPIFIIIVSFNIVFFINTITYIINPDIITANDIVRTVMTVEFINEEELKTAIETYAVIKMRILLLFIVPIISYIFFETFNKIIAYNLYNKKLWNFLKKNFPKLINYKSLYNNMLLYTYHNSMSSETIDELLKTSTALFPDSICTIIEIKKEDDKNDKEPESDKS